MDPGQCRPLLCAWWLPLLGLRSTFTAQRVPTKVSRFDLLAGANSGRILGEARKAEGKNRADFYVDPKYATGCLAKCTRFCMRITYVEAFYKQPLKPGILFTVVDLSYVYDELRGGAHWILSGLLFQRRFERCETHFTQRSCAQTSPSLSPRSRPLVLFLSTP